jgi:DNA polymerase-1
VKDVCQKAQELGVNFVLEGRDPVKPKCTSLCIATDEGKRFVFPAELVEAGVKRILALDGVMDKAFVTQFKELYELGQSFGVELGLPRMECLLAAYVLHPERESPTLPKLALEHLKETLSGQSNEEMARLAGATIKIGKKLEEEIRNEGLYDLLRDVEIPLSRVLAEMERTGVLIDVPALTVLSQEMERQIAQLEREIIEKADAGYFNPNSPKQLADVLFGKMQLEPPRRKKTNTKTRLSTDSEVLEDLIEKYPENPVPRLVLQYRSLTKLKSTYVDTLPGLIHKETGRIHTSFNQTIAATGRLSSSDPNLQNIPTGDEAKIRDAFISSDGHVLVGADYSQIELRVLAHISGDERLIETFEKGIDIHTRTAAKIHGCREEDVTPDMRRAAKTVNFGILYGMSAFRLSRELKISQQEAQRFIDDYYGAYPRVKEYKDEVLRKARVTGYVTTLSGRKRRIEGLNDANKKVQEAAERMAVNTPIQGTASDIIKVAMVRLGEKLKAKGLGAKMILQVHDELVLEAKEEEKEKVCEVVKDVMENAWKLRVPLEVEVGIGKRWSKIK